MEKVDFDRFFPGESHFQEDFVNLLSICGSQVGSTERIWLAELSRLAEMVLLVLYRDANSFVEGFYSGASGGGCGGQQCST